MTERQTLVSHERLVYKHWLDKAALRGVQPSPEAAELVSELLVTYTEAMPDIEPSAGDIYATAHDLATRALESMPVDMVSTVYRDYLLDAMIESSTQPTAAECRSLVRFTNLISSAFCEANSDQLRKTIRRDRAERFSAEMKMAKAIQRQLLPKVIPELPGFDFAGRLIPAAEVGGDYWSIRYYPDDGIVTLKLADISGHGVAAATLVAAVKFISGCYYRRASTAAEVIEHTNRVLTLETPHEILVTMVYGWLRPETYELTVVNGGHEPAFLCRETMCTDIAPTGPALGMAEGMSYGEVKFDLHRGDILFFGSDGIIEAGVGERFGSSRLKKIVCENSDLSANDLADKVVESVRTFAPQPYDDISLLIVKVTGEPAGK